MLLDVVYNHFGSAGNYLPAYSKRYFTSKHRTGWGDAPNFDEPQMRRLVLDNARVSARCFESPHARHREVSDDDGALRELHERLWEAIDELNGTDCGGGRTGLKQRILR